MTRALLNGAAAAALVAATAGASVGILARRGAGPMVMSASAAASPAGTPIYYQDPDGKPLESVRAKLEREVIEKKTILEIPRLAEELRQAAKPVKILKDHEDTKQTIRDVEQEIKPLLEKSEPRR